MTNMEIDDLLFEAFHSMSCTISWCTLALCLFGIVSNAVSIYIYTHRVMRSPVNVLLAGLSAIDLCLSAFCIPSFVVPIWSECYYSASMMSLMAYCTVYIYPFTMMCQSASVWTFLIIAFDRWIANADNPPQAVNRTTDVLLRSCCSFLSMTFMADIFFRVCHPLRARWRTTHRSYTALITVAICAVCYNFVRFFEFRIMPEGDASAQLDPLLKNETLHPFYMPVYYVTLYLITHFVVPFSILISVHILMVLSIVRARRQRSMLGRRQKSEHKTTIMMGVVVLVFLICNTLPFVLNFVEAVNPAYFTSSETMLTAWALLDIGNLLVVFNAASTSLIYCACSQRYRRLFKYTCYRIFCGFRCFPAQCFSHWNSISALSGGYTLTSTSSSFRSPTPTNRTTTTVPAGQRRPAESLCAIALGFLPRRCAPSNSSVFIDTPSPKLFKEPQTSFQLKLCEIGVDKSNDNDSAFL